VPNASRWVTEVQEYRPYPTDDPTFAKLRSNLAKYNPSADTLSRILAALSLP
jgi:competence protein ComEA